MQLGAGGRRHQLSFIAGRGRQAAGAAVAVLACLLSAPAPAAAADCQPSLPACRSLNQAENLVAANQDQLQAIQARRSDLASRMSGLTELITRVQAQIASEQAQIDQTQAQLDAIDRRLRLSGAELQRRQDQVTLRQQLLFQRVRELDKHNSIDYLELIVTSQGFGQLVDRLMLWHRVISSDQQLETELGRQRDQVRRLQDQLRGQHDQKTAVLSDLRRQQSLEQQQVQVQQGAFDALRQADGQDQAEQQAASARQVALQGHVAYLQSLYQEQLQQLLAQSAPRPPAPRQAPPPPSPPQPVAGLRPLFPWVPAGGYPDYFPYGQCTYWAAYNHLVSWNGNATDWLANARRQGAATSASPRVGAVVVWGAGGGYSIYGHVAVVVGVGAGTFTVSEMNYVGLGIVDTRIVAWPSGDVEGFID